MDAYCNQTTALREPRVPRPSGAHSINGDTVPLLNGENMTIEAIQPNTMMPNAFASTSVEWVNRL